MEKRLLGNTGLEVTVIGFGAMTIGGRFGTVDDNESIRALHVAPCRTTLVPESALRIRMDNPPM